MVALLAAAAMGAAGPAMPVEGISFNDRVTLSGAALSLGELADLSRIPSQLQQRASTIKLADAPSAGRTLRIKRDQLIERARAKMPVLVWFLPPSDPSAYVEIVAPQSSSAGNVRAPRIQHACSRVLRTINPGQAPLARDFESTTCNGGETATNLRYDSTSGVLRTADILLEGETVPTPPASLLADIDQNQAISLQVQIGPVLIERQVRSVQPSRGGGRILVRTDDGALISAPHPVDAR